MSEDEVLKLIYRLFSVFNNMGCERVPTYSVHTDTFKHAKNCPKCELKNIIYELENIISAEHFK